MSDRMLDCRGLACPNPVLRTKETIETGDVNRVTVLVDNVAARENVGRFLGRFGYEVGIEEREDGFAVTGFRSGPAPEGLHEEPVVCEQERRIVVMVGTDRLGRGDDELGRKLIASFLGTLKEMGRDLWRLVFLNGGVKLTVEGSQVLSQLDELEKKEVRILVCGTCLGHFGLLEQKRVGETTNMLDIVTAMQLADKVISLT